MSRSSGLRKAFWTAGVRTCAEPRRRTAATAALNFGTPSLAQLSLKRVCPSATAAKDTKRIFGGSTLQVRSTRWASTS